MKRLIILSFLCLLFLVANANDYLTIYNRNQALYKTSIDLDLNKGSQYFSIENIPPTIITETVIFLPSKRNVRLFSQNFEYDLADTQKLMQRNLNQNIQITTDNGQISGTLVFFDFSSYGLIDETTKELNIVNAAEVNNVLLSELPTDFYSRPTLRWQLHARRAGKYTADLSYLMFGIDWHATYNIVLGKDDFTLNSWVTINNNTGKDFENVKLKLIAGNVETHQQNFVVDEISLDSLVEMTNSVVKSPAFAEREFADMRLYTLDQPADIGNSQEKQLSLYPLKTVEYTRKYVYMASGNDVDVFIAFVNSTESGLGVPLPQGNVIFYEIDENDNTQQFVGMSPLNHTSLNQDIEMRIGTAFDIIAETKVLNTRAAGRTISAEYEITLTNNKSDDVEVEVLKYITPMTEIINPSLSVQKRDAFIQFFKVQIAAGNTEKVTFLERSN